MFQEIFMIDYARPLAKRKEARKVCGPYRWRVPKLDAPRLGYGFYTASKGIEMDQAGSSFDLRLEYANEHLPRYSRLFRINGYYCDTHQSEMLKPIIARLPRGRGFLAGWTMGRGMCGALADGIFDTAEDAATAAHDVAERAAEQERAYQEQQDAEAGEEE